MSESLEDLSQSLQTGAGDLESAESEATSEIDALQQFSEDSQDNVDGFAQSVESAQETLQTEVNNNTNSQK